MTTSSKTDRTVYKPEPVGENALPSKPLDNDDPFVDTPAVKGKKKILALKTANAPARRSTAQEEAGVAPSTPTAPPPTRQSGRLRGRMFRPAAATAAEEEGIAASTPPAPPPSTLPALPSNARTGRLRDRMLRPASRTTADEAPLAIPLAAAAGASIVYKKRVIAVGDFDAVINADRTPLNTIPSSPPIAGGNKAGKESPPTPTRRRIPCSVRIKGEDTDELTLPNGRYVVSYDREDTVVTMAVTAGAKKEKQRQQEQKKHVLFSVSPVAQFTPRDGLRKWKTVEKEVDPEEVASEGSITFLDNARTSKSHSASTSNSKSDAVEKKKARTGNPTAINAATSTKNVATATAFRVYGKRIKKSAPVETEAARKLFFDEDEGEDVI